MENKRKEINLFFFVFYLNKKKKEKIKKIYVLWQENNGWNSEMLVYNIVQQNEKERIKECFIIHVSWLFEMSG
jgi:hypothetical protein